MGDLDHLVYATPELGPTAEALAERLGIRAAAGGRHPGRGSRNALLALGPRSYLEIIAPDPDQAQPPEPRWFSLDEVREPRLVAWAVTDGHLEARAEVARAAGMPLGSVAAGSRERSDGQILRWRFTDPAVLAAGGVVPFFIDWGDGAHPADLLERKVRLVELRLEHPEARRVEELLRSLGVARTVAEGERPKLTAVLEGPRGLVEL
jgi:glyoxalase-like protein